MHTETTPNLDAMLTREQCAAWLQMKERSLAAASRGDKPAIPAFRPARFLIRYHPRTIITKLSRDAGLPFDFIAASFGITTEKKSH